MRSRRSPRRSRFAKVRCSFSKHHREVHDMSGINWSWRTVDIVVAAAIAIAFGVVIWGWNQLWAAATPAFVAIPAAQNILYGMWLLPAVLGGLIIRKPGAALFTELVAAAVSAILGSQLGLDPLGSGPAQGVGAAWGRSAYRRGRARPLIRSLRRRKEHAPPRARGLARDGWRRPRGRARGPGPRRPRASGPRDAARHGARRRRRRLRPREP